MLKYSRNAAKRRLTIKCTAQKPVTCPKFWVMKVLLADQIILLISDPETHVGDSTYDYAI